MGYICDFCGEQRAIVYCRSDSASLCLSCDRNVHSANALSRRHSRTLLCERCNSQPAFVRCIEDRVSLCQNCDWLAHVSSASNPAHKRQAVSCYAGCPSAAELSLMWSFLLESPSVGDSTCEQGMGLMSIAENRPSGDIREKDENREGSDLVELGNADKSKSSVWTDSQTPLLDGRIHNPTSSSMQKVGFSAMKGSSLCEDGYLYDDFNMDELDLSMENYEELFGAAVNNLEQLLNNDGIDELFGSKDMSVSNCPVAYAAEGSCVGAMNLAQPACSNAASADSIISRKTEPNICFARQHSGLSFSGLTGESSAGDPPDCGASSMLLMGEPPWLPPGPETPVPSTSRSDAVLRYKEKKKTRKFEKRVRYESRKARADVRRRVKGRFVKANDAYDYDPLSHTRSV